MQEAEGTAIKTSVPGIWIGTMDNLETHIEKTRGKYQDDEDDEHNTVNTRKQ